MEVLLFALFFLVTIIFFVAGKDDFGRKEIKLKSDLNEEVKNDLKDEPKEVIKKEEIENDLKDEPKEVIKKEEIKNDLKDEPKEEVKREVE
mgnify:CR=1 FL=1